MLRDSSCIAGEQDVVNKPIVIVLVADRDKTKSELIVYFLGINFASAADNRSNGILTLLPSRF